MIRLSLLFCSGRLRPTLFKMMFHTASRDIFFAVLAFVTASYHVHSPMAVTVTIAVAFERPVNMTHKMFSFKLSLLCISWGSNNQQYPKKKILEGDIIATSASNSFLIKLRSYIPNKLTHVLQSQTQCKPA